MRFELISCLTFLKIVPLSQGGKGLQNKQKKKCWSTQNLSENIISSKKPKIINKTKQKYFQRTSESRRTQTIQSRDNKDDKRPTKIVCIVQIEGTCKVWDAMLIWDYNEMRNKKIKNKCSSSALQHLTLVTRLELFLASLDALSAVGDEIDL